VLHFKGTYSVQSSEESYVFLRAVENGVAVTAGDICSSHWQRNEHGLVLASLTAQGALVVAAPGVDCAGAGEGHGVHTAAEQFGYRHFLRKLAAHVKNLNFLRPFHFSHIVLAKFKT
jgi:hypothetical protein